MTIDGNLVHRNVGVPITWGFLVLFGVGLSEKKPTDSKVTRPPTLF